MDTQKKKHEVHSEYFAGEQGTIAFARLFSFFLFFH